MHLHYGPDVAVLRRTATSVAFATGHGRRPVEVEIVARLPKGFGDALIADGFSRQAAHPEYVLEFEEPSAKILNTDFQLGDATAVYTFGVGTTDLIFHRHAGHRVIIGTTGGAGANLRFSSAVGSGADIACDVFMQHFFAVTIPADTMFVLRFNGSVWHQFGPVSPQVKTFFAVSVHTDELGGLPEGALKAAVLAGAASIPLLTEPVPDDVMERLQAQRNFDLSPISS